jgi:hypothetical protein
MVQIALPRWFSKCVYQIFGESPVRIYTAIWLDFWHGSCTCSCQYQFVFPLQFLTWFRGLIACYSYAFLAELEESGVGSVLGYRPSFLEEFWLALIHPPGCLLRSFSRTIRNCVCFSVYEIILLFMVTCKNLLAKSPLGDDLKSPLYRDVSEKPMMRILDPFSIGTLTPLER